MDTTTKLQQHLDDLITVQELAKGFGDVTAVTIHAWRVREGMPTVVIRGSHRPSIRFVLSDVQKWAKERGRTLNLKAMKGARSKVAPARESLPMRRASAA